MSDTVNAGQLRQRAAESSHLSDYLRVLVKRRHVAISAFVLTLGLVAVYSFTATKVYEGRAQLLIEADNPNIVSFKEVIDEAQTRQDYYQTQYKLLQSRSLAQKTIETLHLWDNPELAVPSRGAVAPGTGETAAQARTIQAFLDRLTITPIRNSRLIDVSFRSTDPLLAARATTGLAQAFIDQTREFRFNATREASAWLTQQLEEQRKQVEAAEASLQQYRENNDAISLADRENIVVQKLADLNSAVTKAKTERLLKESMYRQIADVEHNPAALDTFPAILGNQYIQQQKSELAALQRQLAQLSEKFGELHPDILRVQSAIREAEQRLQREVAKVVQAVRTEYQAALAQERSLASALDAQKGEAMGMNRKAIEYNVIARDVQSNKEIYQSLLQRTKETGVSGELKSSNVRIVDRSQVPDSPVSPRPVLNLLLGTIAAALISLALTFAIEYFDNRVKSPEEIEANLGLSTMGMIPSIDASAHSNPLLSGEVPPNFGEAFRALRTNVLFSSAQGNGRSIAVTSTGPAEGKTTVAVNLAVAMAQAGQRVLLIDADMRRPRAHSIFDLKQEPGLSNVLAGASQDRDVIQASAVPNLSIMTAGRIPPNPAELLGSPRFGELLEASRNRFDLVLIDTPPVMAVTDAAVVANCVNGVLFVIAADVTARHNAQAALDQLERAHARFVGGVLNRVDLRGNPYYYSRYYRVEYATYYKAA